MAKPQLEDGHTQIANEILEKLAKVSLSPNQWQVLIVILRKTYGFHKKVDYIANFQIGEATGLGKTVVSRCLKGLAGMNIIIRNGKHIGFQKDWEKWQRLAKLLTIDTKLAEQPTNKKLAVQSTELAVQLTELAEQSTKVSSSDVTQKIKETIQKKLYKRYGEFNNVLLTDEEYQKLKDKLGSNSDDWIETLSRGIESKGYKYQSHYATILNWERRDQKEKGSGTHRESSTGIPPRDGYTKPPDDPGLRALVEAEEGATKEVAECVEPESHVQEL